MNKKIFYSSSLNCLLDISDKRVLFWSSIFSQWHPCRIYHTKYDIIFNTPEQAMMYEKAILFGDTKIANAILLADSPKKQKELGRQVRGYDDNIWGEKRYEIVAEINYLKFSQNEPFKSTLLSFAGWEFVEASPDDCIWGIGLSKEDPRALDKSKWRGQNLLGKAINSAQQRIIAEL